MMLSAFCKQYQADLTIFPIIPDDKEKIKELYGDISDQEIYDIIWKKIKEENKKCCEKTNKKSACKIRRVQRKNR